MHKLLLTAIMVASKFSDDTFCSNAFFAETGLVTLEEMNRMEEVFLSAIHFSLYVDERVFLQYYSSLYRHIHFSHCPTCCSAVVWRSSVGSELAPYFMYPTRSYHVYDPSRWNPDGCQSVQDCGCQSVQDVYYQPIQDFNYQPIQDYTYQSVQDYTYQPLQDFNYQPLQDFNYPLPEWGFPYEYTATHASPAYVTDSSDAVELEGQRAMCHSFDSVKGDADPSCETNTRVANRPLWCVCLLQRPQPLKQLFVQSQTHSGHVGGELLLRAQVNRREDGRKLLLQRRHRRRIAWRFVHEASQLRHRRRVQLRGLRSPLAQQLLQIVRHLQQLEVHLVLQLHRAPRLLRRAARRRLRRHGAGAQLSVVLVHHADGRAVRHARVLRVPESGGQEGIGVIRGGGGELDMRRRAWGNGVGRELRLHSDPRAQCLILDH